ncbi:hypothetical protein Mgra_00004677 [Meloidogyne graminicola]|uniref:Uncharacterized protein n=1 Tax=Meloidogyne graminicola TaxID=189291 RepID=A0A8S9ZSE3_9BILA|nr:hypothetical protein Mgra_00004677 [Meloidogyne graminicola]
MFFRRRGFIYILLRTMFYEKHLPLTLLLLLQLHILMPFFSNITTFIEENIESEIGIDCDENETLAYNLKIYNNASHTIHNLIGKKFDCRLTTMLEKFQLTSQEEKQQDFIAEPPGSTIGTIFVTAANLNFYHSLRAVIANIKRAFGVKQKIVAYDLGGIIKNKIIMKELSQICNLEIRELNIKQLPKNVRGMKTFSWKVLLIAHAYLEFDSFIYCDTSVHFASNDFKEHFELINSGKVSPFLFGLGTYHGIKHATLQETFEYIPLFTDNHFDIEMQEANFIIIKRSEFTREILKWALLCAFTLECIEPRKVPWDCPDEIFHTNKMYGLCHRMDQSILSILLHNAEAEIVGKGNKELIRHYDFLHPSHRLIKHLLVRRQNTNEKIAKIYKC